MHFDCGLCLYGKGDSYILYVGLLRASPHLYPIKIKEKEDHARDILIDNASKSILGLHLQFTTRRLSDVIFRLTSRLRSAVKKCIGPSPVKKDLITLALLIERNDSSPFLCLIKRNC